MASPVEIVRDVSASPAERVGDHASMVTYTWVAIERTMNCRTDIAPCEETHLAQSAEFIGISDRQMRRWRERYQEFGRDGLYDRRRGKPSRKGLPLAQVAVLGLYRDRISI
jgi:helix-turn-helix protein